MIRADNDLAFMLQYENIAWYENGSVKILDRRIYPSKIEFVYCKTYREVAKSIRDMVTQSGGPYTAAGMGMALAAYESKDLKEVDRIKFLEEASYILSNARPTTSSKMSRITKECLEIGIDAIKTGKKADEEIFNLTLNNLNNKYIRISSTANFLVDMFPNKGTIMTQCFAETIVGLMLKESINRGKDIKVICPETRPYFQGARLTASVACDQGVDVTVITDNMPGYVLNKKKVDLFTSAADVITMDGHVVNKIGTFQIALAADYYNIPYFVTGTPDLGHEKIESVEIEEREGKFTLEAMGVQTAMDGVKGYYPAFDITAPKLVSGVVTNKGIYSPYDLKAYFNEKGGK